jgi:hypothetical protein
VVFSPTTAGYPAGTVTITGSATVEGSPVALTGNAVVPTYIATITPTSLTFGSQIDGTISASQTLTVTNTGTAVLSVGTFTFSTGFARATGGSAGTCAATLAVNASCTIGVAFSPPTTAPAGAYNGTLTVAYADTGTAATVTPTPVPLAGTAVPQTFTATVTPSPLAFNTWATGTTSPAENLTVTNAGNTALAGGTFTLGGGAPQPFSRVTTGTFPAGAPNCGAALAAGASCTIKVQFAPTTVTTYNRTLTVAYTGATVTPTPVALTGTGVATRATVSISPLTITLPAGTLSGTGTVTLTNTTAAGGADLTVSSVAVSGGSLFTYFFNAVAGADNCTGTTLAPGATCTVGVRFTNAFSPRGVNRTGTITFTDNATGSPQSGTLIGHAN